MTVKVILRFYYGSQYLQFDKEFNLSFVPFYGMILEDDWGKEGRYRIFIVNKENVESEIEYRISENRFVIVVSDKKVTNNVGYPINSGFVDWHVRNFTKANWEFLCSIKIDDFKKMVDAGGKT